jgi:hypothetical protein
MIIDGQVKAKIDVKQQMISFIDTTTSAAHDDSSSYLSVVE